MSPCSRDGGSCYDDQFDEHTAAAELRRFRRKGPRGTTRVLLDALRREGVDGASVLDVGGGVGAIQHELLAAGASRATQVDASRPFLRAAREEAERRGNGGRSAFLHGDFVALSAAIEAADVVTLDRVICCYADMESLVAASASRARRLYGIVVPREKWWVRAGEALGNALRKVSGNEFRSYIHPLSAIERVIAQAGLRPRFTHQGAIWRVAVYARSRNTEAAVGI